MSNLIAFLNMFLSYLLVFVIFMVCIVTAVIVGVKCRKSKNQKEAATQNEEIVEN